MLNIDILFMIREHDMNIIFHVFDYKDQRPRDQSFLEDFNVSFPSYLETSKYTEDYNGENQTNKNSFYWDGKTIEIPWVQIFTKYYVTCNPSRRES